MKMDTISTIFGQLGPLRKAGAGLPGLKLEVISDVTYGPLSQIVEYYCLSNFGMTLTQSVGLFDEFNKYAYCKKDIEKDSIVYFHTSALKFYQSNIRCVDKYKDEARVEELLNSYLETINLVANSYADSRIIINTFELPIIRPRGSYDSIDGLIFMVRRLNQRLIDISRRYPNVFINDVEFLSSQVGLSNWHSLNSWVNFGLPYSEPALIRLGSSLASIMGGMAGRTKKCLITDLDNTYWGGIIGDDGPSKLDTTIETKAGMRFRIYQSYLRDLKKSGVYLAISSKNDVDYVRSHFDSLSENLKLDDFDAHQINWNPKSAGINDICERLNISPSDAIFVDDNPAELNEVSAAGLESIGLRYDDDLLIFLYNVDIFGFFESQKLTTEDRNRKAPNIELGVLGQKESKVDYSDFLVSLNMTSLMSVRDPSFSTRCTSLVNKTNQFNLTQVKLTEFEYLGFCRDDNKWVTCFSLQDIHDSHGITSVIFGTISGNTATIINWVMSCRVFNRNFEFTILTGICQWLVTKGISRVVLTLKHSDRNNYAQNFIKRLEVVLDQLPCAGRPGESSWSFNVENIKEVSDGRFITLS